MAVSEFPAPPIGSTDEEYHRQQISQSVNQVLTGKTNNVLDVTLTASAGVHDDYRCEDWCKHGVNFYANHG